jgi:hypothetical protein
MEGKGIGVESGVLKRRMRLGRGFWVRSKLIGEEILYNKGVIILYYYEN